VLKTIKYRWTLVPV